MFISTLTPYKQEKTPLKHECTTLLLYIKHYADPSLHTHHPFGLGLATQILTNISKQNSENFIKHSMVHKQHTYA